jgi:hypothetical protein
VLTSGAASPVPTRFDGRPIAIAAATAVIRYWRFKPYILNGRSVPVLRHLTIAYDSAR